jgi:hypothetical protein
MPLGASVTGRMIFLWTRDSLRGRAAKLYMTPIGSPVPHDAGLDDGIVLASVCGPLLSGYAGHAPHYFGSRPSQRRAPANPWILAPSLQSQH